MNFNPRAERAEKQLEDLRGSWAHDLHAIREEYEKQIERLIAMHDKQIVLLESQLLDVKYEAMRELAETKKAHVETLQHVINEHEITRGELQRTLRILHPAMQSVEIPSNPSSVRLSQLPEEKPKTKALVPSGTPWQRVQAFYKEHEEEYAFRSRYAPQAEGEPNGSRSEGRVDAPLSGESKPAQ
jgi:chromosome segregation ATPase